MSNDVRLGDLRGQGIIVLLTQSTGLVTCHNGAAAFLGICGEELHHVPLICPVAFVATTSSPIYLGRCFWWSQQRRMVHRCSALTVHRQPCLVTFGISP